MESETKQEDTSETCGTVQLVEQSGKETVRHVTINHRFCSKCGMCKECGDCDIWGCGTI